MKIKWTKKYELALSETLTTKEIMQLVECGQPTALEIRKDAIRYCSLNKIPMYSRSVPTSAVLHTINKDIKYYYDKMQLENCNYIFA